MKISQEEKDRLENLYQTFLHDEKIQQMKEIPMHRGSNCYEHCFKVARKGIRHALKYHKKGINLELVLIGAILHDYYLYDWRKDKSKRKRHGSDHPFIAANNAKRDFDISDPVREIIERHMWPINLNKWPDTTEARIVSVSDKAVTIGEALTSKAYKKKKREKFLKNISTLFGDYKEKNK